MKRLLVTRSTDMLPGNRKIEIVERKGNGHPDTLIDGIMEEVSREFCKAYLSRFGVVKHHNVDKGLICGGATEVEFGGGRFTRPIRIILSGRASAGIPFEEIAIKTAKEYLEQKVRHLDLDTGVLVQSEIAGIWPKWDELSKGLCSPLSNDTSCGVGYAPLSETERLILGAGKLLNSENIRTRNPFIGEDIKIMGLRRGGRIELTVAAAIVSRYVKNLNEYKCAKKTIEHVVSDYAKTMTEKEVRIFVNPADSEEDGSIYLTLSGTSAEMGDDGSVGRGNRANGLITPMRPMTLEAIAGKNPLNHTGKIYSVLAFDIAQKIAGEFELIDNVDVHLLSRIGHPIDEPSQVSVSVNSGSDYFDSLKEKIEWMVEEEIRKVTTFSQRWLKQVVQCPNIQEK